MYKYALRYQPNLERRDEGYTANDVENTGHGLTDCFLGISILLPPDGTYSQAIVVSENGKEKRTLTQKEIFKSWLMLGLSLHDKGELKGWQKDFVKMHSEMIRSIFNHSDNCATLKGKKDD
jgi:hypothetical protein